MIHLLYGEDEFRRSEFLDSLRWEIGSPELLEANTVVLAGAVVSLQYLQEVCSVLPFLAEHRLVVVEGLLAQFDNVRTGRRRGRSVPVEDALREWNGLSEVLLHIPPGTILVFREDSLRLDNPLLQEMRVLSNVVQVQEFPVLTGEALKQWIRQRVGAAGVTIDDKGVRRLVDLVGGNLRVLSSEVEKLALYSGGKGIDEDAVVLLVAHMREANIFKAVDAILERRTSSALQLISWLRQEGAEVPYIVGMLARQLRLILLTHELLTQQVPRSKLGRRLGLTAEFAVKRTHEQAKLHSKERAVAMYRRVLEADLAIKRGELGEDLALETLVADLCHDFSNEALSSTRSVSH